LNQIIAPAQPSSSRPRPGAGTLYSPRVIVGEDDPDIRRLVATALRVDGYTVVEAEDGRQVLEHFGSALLLGHMTSEPEPIALVISDIRMPHLTGLDLLAGLRSAEFWVAMILMSAYGDYETRERARSLGADAFVHKPFDVAALRNLVHDIAPIAMPDCL
jgi:DNA-binding response OmpR family regulator